MCAPGRPGATASDPGRRGRAAPSPRPEAARTPVAESDPRVVPLPLEVTDGDSIAELARAAGDISIVINNAGISDDGPLTEVGIDEVRAVFEANVFGTLRVAQTFAPVLAAHGGGALIDIHSVLS